MYFIYLKDDSPHFNYCETRMHLRVVLEPAVIVACACSYLVVIPDNMIR